MDGLSFDDFMHNLSSLISAAQTIHYSRPLEIGRAHV